MVKRNAAPLGKAIFFPPTYFDLVLTILEPPRAGRQDPHLCIIVKVL